MTVEMGRNENRAQNLRGMGDVDSRAEGGAFFNYLLPQGLALTSSLRYGSGDEKKGLIVDLGASHSSVIAERWRLSTGLGITLANAQYQQSYFGVTRAQSAASGYTFYMPGSGVRDLRAKAALTYSIDPRTSLTAALTVSSLQGDAKNSPLTRKRTSGTGVMLAAYSF
jgi:outer membrane scaffolding protein for murein synthesis (MipA/OmpV family)